MLSSRYYTASRLGTDAKPRTAMVIDDDDDDLYQGFNEVSPALDTRALREDQAFQEVVKTASYGRKLQSRLGTGMFRQGTVNVRAPSSRLGTATNARPMTAVRAAGYTSTARSTPSQEEKKEDSVEDKIKHMEMKIMSLVEESCLLSARPSPDDDTAVKRELDLGKALEKAQEASTLERQLIRIQEQANLGDSHNLDLTFAVLCNLAGQYALNEMYAEALNTYQLLTRNKLFPHANRLKVNMGNIYFKMGEHPKALKLYRMALDQTSTAEKDLRMKVMHNIGLLLVRMGKFRDAVTNFQHIMHEQGDFQTGLHLVLCSVAMNDVEGSKAAFHAMLDVEAPNYHQDINVDDESDPCEAVLCDVVRADRLSTWSRRAAADAEKCLLIAAAAAASLNNNNQQQHDYSMSWCVEALRGYEAGTGAGSSAGVRLELSTCLWSLSGRTRGSLSRLRALARTHHHDPLIRSEANADAAFVAYALGNYSEARSLAEAASRDDPYSCRARVTTALSEWKESGSVPSVEVIAKLSQATHLDPADMVALHDLALCLECGGVEGGERRWSRGAAAGGATLRTFALLGLARGHHSRRDTHTAEHWYSAIGNWDVSVTSALARLHSDMGDTQTAKHHYQDVESIWPCDLSALEWLGAEARSSDPEAALQYYRRAARLQPNNPQWGLLIGGCLRASGRYQDALTLYKKMNTRFPDNVQCLKLIVKLCGDQGLPETAAWNRELQRAQARVKQQERTTSLASADSTSSRTSHSPMEINKEGHRTALTSGSRSQVSTSSSGTAGSKHLTEDGRGDHIPQRYPTESNKDKFTRSGRRDNTKKKSDDFGDDLPLPPE